MLISLTDCEGASSPRLYEVGQLVRHKLYGYRGVIVSFDCMCMAGEKWYMANKSQPPRNQPWYHILVHDSGGLSTYVAQSNLESDSSQQPINHPRIESYFCGFKDGAYVQNTKASSASKELH